MEREQRRKIKTGREATSAATRTGSRSGKVRLRGPAVPAVRTGLVRQAEGGGHRQPGARLQGNLLGRQGETGLVQESGYFLKRVFGYTFILLQRKVYSISGLGRVIRDSCRTCENGVRACVNEGVCEALQQQKNVVLSAIHAVFKLKGMKQKQTNKHNDTPMCYIF